MKAQGSEWHIQECGAPRIQAVGKGWGGQFGRDLPPPETQTSVKDHARPQGGWIGNEGDTCQPMARPGLPDFPQVADPPTVLATAVPTLRWQ